MPALRVHIPQVRDASCVAALREGLPACGLSSALPRGDAFKLEKAGQHFAALTPILMKTLEVWAGKKLVTLHRRPPEQVKAHLGEFLKRVQDARELHMAELPLLDWHLKGNRGAVECAAGLLPPRRCSELALNVLGSFDFAMGLVPQDVGVETSLWIGSLESQTGLHADIEFFNLLVSEAARPFTLGRQLSARTSIFRIDTIAARR